MGIKVYLEKERVKGGFVEKVKVEETKKEIAKQHFQKENWSSLTPQEKEEAEEILKWIMRLYEGKKIYICPLCGREVSYLRRDGKGEIIGCDFCLKIQAL